MPEHIDSVLAAVRMIVGKLHNKNPEFVLSDTVIEEAHQPAAVAGAMTQFGVSGPMSLPPSVTVYDLAEAVHAKLAD